MTDEGCPHCGLLTCWEWRAKKAETEVAEQREKIARLSAELSRAIDEIDRSHLGRSAVAK